jgi:DnaJ family protein A protein 2
MAADDLFAHFFGGGNARQSGPRRGKDLKHALKISLEEFYNGKTTKLALNKTILCSACNGKGGKDGAVRTCDGCNGSGVKVTVRQMGPMIQQMQSTCGDCRGSGEIIREKDRCKTCKGKKVTQEKKILDVYVDKGMKNGQKITFSGEGDQAPDIIPGDVIIVLEEKPHAHFKRKDNDLMYSAKIDLLTALNGGDFGIKHLDGRILKVNITPGDVVKPGTLHREQKFTKVALTPWLGEVKAIHGEGMPGFRRPFDKGTLYVQFEIEFPSPFWTSPETISLLEEILPPRKECAIKLGADAQEVTLSSLSASQQTQARQSAQDDMDVDQEEKPQVACAQQ